MTVFLSHSTKDQDFVEKLAAAMIANGFTPWRCEVDVEQGANFVSNINAALAVSDVALLVWSPDAAKSAWTEQEWTSLFARQVEEQMIRLGVIRLRDCDLPELLRTSNWIEGRLNGDAAIQATVEWLGNRQKAQRFSGLQAPVFLDYRPKDFVGRTGYLERLHSTLTQEPTVFLLYGEPGAGKSALALQFAWEAQKDFDAVIFQVCGQRSLDAITADLVRRLPLDVRTKSPEQQRAAAKTWLHQRQSLLVLDDVWSGEIRQLEPGPACSVLYTSRFTSLPWISSKASARVEKFTEAEIEALFHTCLDSEFGAGEVTRNREVLLRFAGSVDSLPAAVAVGANLLREKAASALSRAVLKLRVNELSDGASDVNALFRAAIESQATGERQLLAASAMCAPEGFWLPLAAEIAQLSEGEAEDAADRLVRLSLLRVTDRARRRFHLHALLREEVFAIEGHDDMKHVQEQHAAALEKVFGDWETRRADCHESLHEVTTAVKSLWDRGESDRASALSAAGFRLGWKTGEYAAALRILRQEESLWAERDTREALFMELASRGNQASILMFWGRLEEAMALHKKQEAAALKWGIGSYLAGAYQGQAIILREWERTDEALEMLKKEESVLLESGAKCDLASCYCNQATFLVAQGRLAEAMALFKKEEAIVQELGDKRQLAACYGNQAIVLSETGQLDGARALCTLEEAIALECGDQDLLASSYASQAAVLQREGRIEETLALLKKQEEICVQLCAKVALQECYGNQVSIMTAQGRLQEASILLQKREEICAELGNRSLGDCYRQRARVAREQGDSNTERQSLQQALAVYAGLKMASQRYEVQKELKKLAAQ